MRSIRKDMLAGKRVSACSACYYVEEAATGRISCRFRSLPLEWFYGPARVLRIPKQAGEPIEAGDLQPHEKHLTPGARIFYETGWHRRFGEDNFFSEFPSLTQEAARYLASRKIRMLGMDTPTPSTDWYEVHHILLGEEIVIVESVANLDRVPDETTLLNFRHLLEEHKLTQALFDAINRHLTDKGLLLKQGTIVDATLIHAPSSTKNASGERDPEMHQTKKGNQWYFGMKAHIGVDAASGLVHTVVGTAGNVADVTQAHALLHGDESTATSALFDLFWYLHARRTDAVVREILSKLTLHAIPLLNPDGAERFQRRNAQSIDVNRDALRLQTPEGRALKALRDRFQPRVGFNLHNQSWRSEHSVSSTRISCRGSLVAMTRSTWRGTSSAIPASRNRVKQVWRS